MTKFSLFDPLFYIIVFTLAAGWVIAVIRFCCTVEIPK